MGEIFGDLVKKGPMGGNTQRQVWVITLKQVPLSVAELLHERFSIVLPRLFVSATLTPTHFEYIKGRLASASCRETIEVMLPPRSTILIRLSSESPRIPPSPDHPDFGKSSENWWAVDEISEEHSSCSRSLLHRLFKELQALLKRRFSSSDAGSSSTPPLAGNFPKDATSVLFATDSFGKQSEILWRMSY
jgi:hypothetical protein